MTTLSVHPFPARMAPELACTALDHLEPGQRVLDPMCGSGSVLRACVERGIECAGIDLDPLAVMMSRVWVTPMDIETFVVAADALVDEARSMPSSSVRRIRNRKTRDFTNYWFAAEQRHQLARLGTALRQVEDGCHRDAMSIAMSRLIITKDRGASLARDVSHSRPHRVADSNNFDVYDAFLKSARQIGVRLKPTDIKAGASVLLGDARDLSQIGDDSFDAVVTSPPYLNAIDYMRGHRLALVWLGFDVDTLSEIRSSSIGSERMQSDDTIDVERHITSVGSPPQARNVGWFRRYAQDLGALFDETARVVKPDGQITIVVANSMIRGATYDNASLVVDVACARGLRLLEDCTRVIPASRRYLPPPTGGQGALHGRMREESVLRFQVLPTAS